MVEFPKPSGVGCHVAEDDISIGFRKELLQLSVSSWTGDVTVGQEVGTL